METWTVPMPQLVFLLLAALVIYCRSHSFTMATGGSLPVLVKSSEGSCSHMPPLAAAVLDRDKKFCDKTKDPVLQKFTALLGGSDLVITDE